MRRLWSANTLRLSIYMRPEQSQARQTRKKEVFTRCPSNK